MWKVAAGVCRKIGENNGLGGLRCYTPLHEILSGKITLGFSASPDGLFVLHVTPETGGVVL